MKWLSFLLVLVLSLGQLSAQNWNGISSDHPVSPSVEINSAQQEAIHVDFTLGGFFTQAASNGQGVNPFIEEGTPLLESGKPALQKYALPLIIDMRKATRLKIESAEYTDYPNLNIPNYQEINSRNIEEATTAPVNTPLLNEFYPQHTANLSTPYIVRDYRGQTLNLFPFSYNPTTQTLRVYHHIKISINYLNETGLNTLEDQRTTTTPAFEQLYQSLFANYSTTKAYDPVSEEGKLLVVCHPDFMCAMQDFVEWKNQSGRPTKMVDASEFNSAEKLKSYINYLYETDNLTYVLLVGDSEQIPSLMSEDGFSDNTYGYLAGDDHYAEVFVGRFPAETESQVRTMVNRSLQYEKQPATNGAYDRCMGIASSSGPGDDNEYDYQHVRKLLNQLKGDSFQSSAELYDGDRGEQDKAGNPTKHMVAYEVNKGTGLIIYTGVGKVDGWFNSGFEMEDVMNLHNTETHPIILSASCFVGSFVNNTCFAESWLRAGTPEQPKGAVAALMSTGRQTWAPPMHGQDEMINIITGKKSYTCRTLGGIALHGCMEMVSKYGNTGQRNADIWNLFGDPSLPVRTAKPITINVEHEQKINALSQRFAINALQKDLRATLSYNGEILGSSPLQIGENQLELTPLGHTGVLTLTVTGYNCTPYTKEINVTNEPATAENMLPTQHEAMVSTRPAFSWTAENGMAADYYEIIISTEIPTEGTPATATTTNTNYKPAISLEYNTTYFWQVISVNAHGRSKSPVMDFHVIGLPDENFEGINSPKWVNWDYEGNARWITDTENHFNGRQSARSGDIHSGQKSIFSCNSTCQQEGFVIFWMKTESTKNIGKLQFFVDDELKGEWSGLNEWTEITFPIAKGTHNLLWQFEHCGQSQSHAGYAWIDDIYLPGLHPMQIESQDQIHNCAGTELPLLISIENQTSLTWSSNGSGCFDDILTDQPIYTPSQEDIENGHVDLQITATNAYSGLSITQTMELLIHALPEVTLASEIVAPANQTLILEAEGAADYNYFWSSLDATGNQVEIPADWAQPGTQVHKVLVADANGCQTEKQIAVLFKEQLEDEALTMQVYPNPSSGDLHVNIKSERLTETDAKITVFNQMGSLVLQQEITGMSFWHEENLSLEALQNGIYYLTVAQAGHRTTQKVVLLR